MSRRKEFHGAKNHFFCFKDIMFSVLFSFKKISDLFSGRDSVRDLPAIFGFLPRELRRQLKRNVTCIVIAVYGDGEALNSMPIASSIRTMWPDCNIVFLTHNTAALRKIDGLRKINILVLPYPVDIPWVVRSWVERVRPKVFLMQEGYSRLGPNLLERLREVQGTRTVLANAMGNQARPPGRLGLLKAELYGRRLCAATGQVMAVSQEAKAFYADQGVLPENIAVVKNIKFGTSGEDVSPEELRELRARFGIAEDDRVVVMGSVYPEEIEILMTAYEQLLRQPGLENTKLIIAPRGGSGGEFLAQMLRSKGYEPAFASARHPCANGRYRQVVILDTFGELRKIYALATVVVMGGSWSAKFRGHNPIEPAYQSKPMIMGAYTASFQDVIACFAEQDAIVQLEKSDLLADRLILLMTDAKMRRNLGEKARKVVDTQQAVLKWYLSVFKSLVES